MSKAPPPPLPTVEEARKKLLKKLQENIKKKIKLLESAIDTYVEDAVAPGTIITMGFHLSIKKS